MEYVSTGFHLLSSVELRNKILQMAARERQVENEDLSAKGMQKFSVTFFTLINFLIYTRLYLDLLLKLS